MTEFINRTAYWSVLSLLYGTIGFAIVWIALGAFFWLPYHSFLASYHFYIDDKGVPLGALFLSGPIGLIFYVFDAREPASISVDNI